MGGIDVIDIEPRHLKMVKSVLARHLPYKTVWAYGSRVKWNASETSDLDCVVFGATNKDVYNAKEAFDESDIPFIVQLLSWEKIPDNFKANIQRNYEVLQGKPKLDNWKEYKLGDVAEIVGGGTPKTKVREYWNGEIPWLTPRDLSNFSGRYISSGERSLSQLGLNNSSAKILTKGTVLLSSRAPVGYLGIALNEITTNQGFRSLIPNSKSDSLFLFYLLKNNVEYLKSQSTGTTFGELSGSTLKSLSFLFPPLPEQKAIAGVLSSLDDKIDLLHRQNKTLEAIAETLFRQWFVEEAQEDWEEKPLSSIAEHKKINIRPGQNPRTIYCHYSIPAFDDGKHPIKELGSEIKSNKYQVFANSILISKLNPRFPRVWAISDLLDENSICSTEFQVVLPIKSECYSFIYCFLKSKQVKDELIGAAGRTSGSHQRVKPEDIFNLKLQMPTQKKIDYFSSLTSENWKKITNNMRQIRTLKKLRDTLLPKLMNGEWKVRALGYKVKV